MRAVLLINLQVAQKFFGTQDFLKRDKNKIGSYQRIRRESTDKRDRNARPCDIERMKSLLLKRCTCNTRQSLIRRFEHPA